MDLEGHVTNEFWKSKGADCYKEYCAKKMKEHEKKMKHRGKKILGKITKRRKKRKTTKKTRKTKRRRIRKWLK